MNARNEAIVRFRMRGPGHSGLDVDVVVDSGFTSTLALPSSTIAALGLIRGGKDAGAEKVPRTVVSDEEA